MKRYHRLEVPLLQGLRWTVESLTKRQEPPLKPIFEMTEVEVTPKEEDDPKAKKKVVKTGA